MTAMRCERCRRRMKPEEWSAWRRVQLTDMERNPEYELLLCPDCAKKTLDFVYRREREEPPEIWDEIRFR